MSDEMKNNQAADGELNDPVLESALKDFRASVHAWSDAAYHRSRPLTVSAKQKIAWRRATAWVLSLVLSFGIIGSAAWQRHEHQVAAVERQHQQEMERQRVLAEKAARESEDLMANIDNDVSRQVPAAMEPLELTTDQGQ